MIVVNAAAPAPSPGPTPGPAPAPGPGFVPTDTDCIKWIKVNNLDSDDMPGEIMPIGHQGPCSGAGAPPGICQLTSKLKLPLLVTYGNI